MKKCNAIIADWAFCEKAKPLNIMLKSDIRFLSLKLQLQARTLLIALHFHKG